MKSTVPVWEKCKRYSRKWECKYQLYQLIEPIASANAFQQPMKRVGKSLVKIINKWGSRMMCYNNRKKLKNKWIKINLTKRQLTLLNQERAKTFNCRLQLKTKSGYFYSFNTMGELDDILTEIEEEDRSVSE